MAKRKRRTFTPEFKAEVVLEALRAESSQAELCRRHNLSEDQLSKWKQQFLENAASLFESTDKASEDAAERIAHLEHLGGRLTVALDIRKKALTYLSRSHLNNAKVLRRCGEIIRCDRFARRLVSTRALSIINRKSTRLKKCCELK